MQDISLCYENAGPLYEPGVSLADSCEDCGEPFPASLIPNLCRYFNDLTIIVLSDLFSGLLALSLQRGRSDFQRKRFMDLIKNIYK